MKIEKEKGKGKRRRKAKEKEKGKEMVDQVIRLLAQVEVTSKLVGKEIREGKSS